MSEPQVVGQDGGSASLYDCHVVQIRTGGSCEEPRPACPDSGGAGTTFQLQVSGNRVTWLGCFSCVGTWSGGDFSCQLDSGVTAVGGMPCPPEPWVLLQQDPIPARPLNPGEIYAGIPVNNSFNAHCAPH